MNSSLQCLAHAAPLMRVFLGGAYKVNNILLINGCSISIK